MRTIIKKYSIRALLLSFILIMMAFVVGKSASFKVQEVFGYISITVSLLLMYPAMRQYKVSTSSPKKYIDFFTIGLMITLAVSIGSSIADYIFVTALYPDFLSDYTQYMLSQLEVEYAGDELLTKKNELLAQVQSMGKPMMMVGFMFLTVIIIGTILSLLLSLFMSIDNE